MMRGQNFHVHAKVERQGVVLHAVLSVAVQTEADLEPLVKGLLQQFKDVFVEPCGLPPIRSHDH